MDRRNTHQRELVLDAVNNLDIHPTAEEVFSYVVTDNPTIGKGTVYRNLNILVEEGLVKRVEIPNGSDRFDHTLCEHYHVECIKCRKVFDAEIDPIPNMKKHIHDTQGFKYIEYDILFKGICPNCQKI